MGSSLWLKKSWYTLDMVSIYVWKNLWLAIGAFLTLFIIRIFIFLPSTVIILAFWMLTQDIWLTFIVSMIGVVIGLVQTYYIGYLLNNGVGSDSQILQKVQLQIKKIKKWGFTYILVGCFFPVFPTDVICYAAGFIRFDFKKYLWAATLWETILVLGYSFLWKNVEQYFIPLSITWIIWIWIYLLYLYIIKQKSQWDR